MDLAESEQMMLRRVYLTFYLRSIVDEETSACVLTLLLQSCMTLALCVALLTLWQGDQGVAFLRFLPLGGDLGVGLVFIFGLQGCQTALMLFLGSNAKRARLIS